MAKLPKYINTKNERFDNYASAISGGLAVGDIYKTSTGELRIRV